MFHALRTRLRTLFTHSATERDLIEEMRFHVDRDVARNVAAGMSDKDAIFAARRAFGNAPALQEEARDAFGTRLLHDLGSDFRYAMRVLRRSAAFTAVV